MCERERERERAKERVRSVHAAEQFRLYFNYKDILAKKKLTGLEFIRFLSRISRGSLQGNVEVNFPDDNISFMMSSPPSSSPSSQTLWRRITEIEQRERERERERDKTKRETGREKKERRGR